jgi:excisionase family DNA binding protein
MKDISTIFDPVPNLKNNPPMALVRVKRRSLHRWLVFNQPVVISNAGHQKTARSQFGPNLCDSLNNLFVALQMELRSVVDFLNKQMELSWVLLVEARQYTSGATTVVVPTLFGYTEEARRAKRPNRQADACSFLSQYRDKCEQKRMKDDGNVDELLTVEEVATLLRVPKSWIYQHTRKRDKERLPHVKLGKYLRFFASDIRKFLESKTSNDRS